MSDKKNLRVSARERFSRPLSVVEVDADVDVVDGDNVVAVLRPRIEKLFQLQVLTW